MFADILEACRDLFSTDRLDLEQSFRRHSLAEEPSWVTDRQLFANLSRHDPTLNRLRQVGRRRDEEEMGQALLDHMRDRMLPRFPFAPADREESAAALLEDREATAHARAWADLVCNRTFHSCYHKRVEMGSCLDWYSDLEGKSWFYEHVKSLRTKIFEEHIQDTLKMGPLRVTWDFNTLQHLVELGKAYWISGEERYAAQYVLQALDWAGKNPPNMGINWIDEMSVARRAIAWVLAFHLFLPSPHVTGDFVKRAVKMALMHGAYLADYLKNSKEEERPGYRLGAAAALYLVAVDLPEFRSCLRWKEIAEVLLPAALDEEFGESGAHRSGSFDMHRMCCEFAIIPPLLASLNGGGLSSACEHRTVKAFRFLLDVREPQGTYQPFGASWPERVLCMGPPYEADVPGLMALAAVLFHRPEFKRAGRRTWTLAWLRGLGGINRFERMERVVMEEEPVVLFPQSALAVMRDGGDEKGVWATVRVVPPPDEVPRGRFHDDLLHVSMAVRGSRMFIDTGAFMLDDARAQYFDSPLAHNTLVVLGARPVPLRDGGGEPGGVHRLARGRTWLRAGRRAWDRTDRVVWHRRDLLFDPEKESLSICDALEGEGVVDVELSFHVPLDMEVVQRGDFGCIFWKRTGLMRLHPFFPDSFRGFVEKGREKGHPAFACRDGTTVEPVQRVRFAARLELPSWVISWMTWDVGSSVTPSVEEARAMFLELGASPPVSEPGRGSPSRSLPPRP